MTPRRAGGGEMYLRTAKTAFRAVSEAEIDTFASFIGFPILVTLHGVATQRTGTDSPNFQP